MFSLIGMLSGCRGQGAGWGTHGSGSLRLPSCPAHWPLIGYFPLLLGRAILRTPGSPSFHPQSFWGRTGAGRHWGCVPGRPDWLGVPLTL